MSLLQRIFWLFIDQWKFKYLGITELSDVFASGHDKNTVNFSKHWTKTTGIEKWNL